METDFKNAKIILMRHVLFSLNPIIEFQGVLDICRIGKGGINLAGNFQPSHEEIILKIHPGVKAAASFTNNWKLIFADGIIKYELQTL